VGDFSLARAHTHSSSPILIARQLIRACKFCDPKDASKGFIGWVSFTVTPHSWEQFRTGVQELFGQDRSLACCSMCICVQMCSSAHMRAPASVRSFLCMCGGDGGGQLGKWRIYLDIVCVLHHGGWPWYLRLVARAAHLRPTQCTTSSGELGSCPTTGRKAGKVARPSRSADAAEAFCHSFLYCLDSGARFSTHPNISLLPSFSRTLAPKSPGAGCNDAVISGDGDTVRKGGLYLVLVEIVVSLNSLASERIGARADEAPLLPMYP
jgi:hypothetical protein